MSDFWYNALSAAKQQGHAPEPGRAGDSRGQRPIDRAPDSRPTGVPALPRSAVRRSDGEEPATQVRLQTSELQRLSDENERLLGRIDTLLRIQEREQVLRQQLQTQVVRLTDRFEAGAPMLEQSAISREVRDGVVADLKPILVAVVELLELATRMADSAPDADPSRLDGGAAPGEDFRKLPDILTRPLEDLATEGHGDDVSTNAGKRLAAGLLKRAVAGLADNPIEPRPIRLDASYRTSVYS